MARRLGSKDTKPRKRFKRTPKPKLPIESGRKRNMRCNHLTPTQIDILRNWTGDVIGTCAKTGIARATVREFSVRPYFKRLLREWQSDETAEDDILALNKQNGKMTIFGKEYEKKYLDRRMKRRILCEIAKNPEFKGSERIGAIDCDNKMEGHYQKDNEQRATKSLTLNVGIDFEQIMNRLNIADRADSTD